MHQILKIDHIANEILDYLPLSDFSSLSACNRFTADFVGNARIAMFRKRILRAGISSYAVAYNLLDHYFDTQEISISQLEVLITDTGKLRMTTHELGKLFVLVAGRIHCLNKYGYGQSAELPITRGKLPQITVMKMLIDIIRSTGRLSQKVSMLANDSYKYDMLSESFCDYIQNTMGFVLPIPHLEKLFIELGNVFTVFYGGYENVEGLQRILNEGGCLDVKISGEPHLVKACETGSYEFVECMLNSWVFIDCQSKDGKTPLAAAIASNRKDIVELLMNCGANLNLAIPKYGSLLHFALEHHSNIEIFELLLKSGINLESKNPKGETVLHSAIKEGLSRYADAIMRAGVDLESKTADGDTPLILARKYNLQDIAASLLERGAKMDVQINFGNTES